MNNVYFTIGISASGKTTWAKNSCKETNAVRINRDDLRGSLFGLSLQEYFDTYNDHKDKEKIISSLVFKMANEALKQGKDVVLDNTHLSIKYIKEILNNIEGNVVFRDIWFLENPQTCIERDQLREVSVGADVINKQSQQFNDLWQQEKQVIKLIEDRQKLNFTPVVQDSSLPKAVIFDIDGTLAKMNNRSPYDWDRVDEDSLNESVNWMFTFVQNYRFAEHIRDLNDSKVHVVICTGRDGKAEVKTKQWLRKHSISYSDFYIRKENDNRKDSIIKHEFLQDIIKKYHIIAVFDDRDQVVRMWRDCGITCFQVDYGDF